MNIECEVNVSNVESQEELNLRCKAAAFFGTLQAGLTDFHYLRPIWKKTTEKEALIGVGMTGIASGTILKLDLQEAADVVKKHNALIAECIGINAAARCTTIKPSGTTSCVLGTSSGIHAWHDNYYIRRMRVMKNEPLYLYLSVHHPELVEDDKLKSYDTAIISLPQHAPKGSITRTESALELLERVKKFNLEWVREGHRKGDNTNNVSATISIKDVDPIKGEFSSNPIEAFGEWGFVGNWMWENKDTFNGLSVLPADGGTYVQMPFESTTKEKYEEMYAKLKDIDLSNIIEIDDNTDLAGEIACGANGCEIR